MTAMIVQIADAVAAAIAAAPLTPPVAPSRTWQPQIDREKLEGPVCYVYPATVEREQISRSHTQRTFVVAVLYAAPIKATTAGEINDALVDQHVEIVDAIAAV